MKKILISGLVMITFLVLFCEKQHGTEKELADFSKQSVIAAPDWARNGILYQVFPRVFTEEGTFKALRNNLDYIKELGVDVIWLLPIYPIGQKGKKGEMGCPFSVQDFRKINPEYGTKEDFKKLVIAVHNKGMKIILGMVPNHGSNDNNLMKEHPDWFMRDEDGNFTREVADWSDITDFNYDNPQLRKYILETYKYWIEEFDIDGYRMDVAGMVPMDFWKNTLTELRKIKSDVYFLAEWEKPEMLINGFNSDYDWTLYHLLRDIKKGKKNSSDAVEYVSERDGRYPKNSLMMRFLENHDEQRSLNEFGEKAIEAYATFLFTLPGIPLIYAGQEMGELEKPTLFDDFAITLPGKNNSQVLLYKKLIKMRKGHKCFTQGDFIPVKTNNDKVGAFIRKAKESAALIVCNLQDEPVSKIVLELPEEYEGKLENNKIESMAEFTTKVFMVE